MSYKCINSFTDTKGQHHSYGHTLSSLSGLQPEERRHYEEESDIVDDIVDAGITLGADSIISDILDGFSGSSDSGGSSFDFGGGDTGGGGASSDW